MAKLRQYVLAVMAVALLGTVSAQATSHVRIVRLSYTDGRVQLERAAGQGLERAILNSPIVEGSRVVTGTDGLAEVEFEDNSTLRLGEATEVKFRQLLINDAGDKVNEVELLRGTLYCDRRSSKRDIFRVIAADRTFVIQPKSQVRFLTSEDQVQAAVLNGEVQLDNNAELVRIKKNDTLTVNATNPAGFVVAKGVESLPLDRWNNERAAYQTVYAYNNNYGYGNNGLSTFGFQDLAYYGGFMNVPGYGLAWQPYGVSNWIGWNPYIAGAWAFTPGFGYTWASAYPWGWMPYHYGCWAYQSGTGWFWVPGNTLKNGGMVTNWQPTAPVVNGPAGYRPPTPPTVPSAGPRPAILVGQIGRVQAYIPGGPVPPNFRSVIDRSSVVGMSAPMQGATAGGHAAVSGRNSRAANFSSSTALPATGSTFVTQGQDASRARFSQDSFAAGNGNAGHVFRTPSPPAWSSSGFASPSMPSYGRGAASMPGTGASARSYGATGHASGSVGTAHGTASPGHK